jgi:hypothetical protein
MPIIRDDPYLWSPGTAHKFSKVSVDCRTSAILVVSSTGAV